jgi:HK97 family phage prohead protease
MEYTERTIESDGLGFILSDGSIDRYGDVIEPGGWKLQNFRKNPIALWGHMGVTPIGRWENVRIEGDALRGELKFAEPGTSALIDTVRALFEQKIVRAVSVGFRALEQEPLDPKKPYDGQRFKEQELLEVSLVSVPANPNAIAIAKQFNLTPKDRELIFAAPGRRDQSAKPGASAEYHTITPRVKPMQTQTTVGQRIQAAEASIVALRDKLNGQLAESGDVFEPARIASIEEITAEIENHDRNLGLLRKIEKAQGAQSEQVQPPALGGQQLTSNIIVPKGFPGFKQKDIKPRDFMARALAVRLKSVCDQIPIEQVLRSEYSGDNVTGVLLRAASAPARTDVAGWAAELINTVLADFLESLNPFSVYPSLAAAGVSLNFDRNGIIKLPSRNRLAANMIAGDFVGEGLPIPVKQLLLQSITLTPKKMAVISTFTRELAAHSTPSIEGVIREAIAEDTAILLDNRLLDTAAGSTTRPAGLLNGLALGTGVVAGTAGGGSAAMLADLKALIGYITAQNGGRRIVIIMNAAQALSLSLATTTTGDFIDYRNKLNVPIIATTNLPLTGTVPGGVGSYPIMIGVDAADFATATGAPEFQVSDTATLHMESATPAPIVGGAGSPAAAAIGDVAAPVRSLFQTATLGIRMILDIAWAMRRTGMVVYVNGLTW